MACEQRNPPPHAALVDSLLQQNNHLHRPCRANHTQQRIFKDDMVVSHKIHNIHVISAEFWFHFWNSDQHPLPVVVNFSL